MFKFLNKILSNFDLNLYYGKNKSLEERNNILKEIFEKLDLQIEFTDEVDNDTIYPICNLSNPWIHNKEVFSDELINYINNGLKVIIFNVNETIREDAFEEFITYLKNKNIEEKNIYFLVNNWKIDLYKKKYNSNINYHNPIFLHKVHSEILQANKVNFVKNKKFYFMCHNNKMWLHRYLMVSLLHYNNFLKDTDYSVINCDNYSSKHDDYLKKHANSSLQHVMLTDDELEKYSKSFMFVKELNNKRSYYETNLESIDSNFIETKTFEQSFINIVNETDFDDKTIHITEKSLKPFYYYQYPIFVAPYEHCKYLRDYGFDFFDDIIDHSYDNEKNNKKRIFMIIEELIRIKDNIGFFKNNYSNFKSRFIKNQKIVMDLVNLDNDKNYLKRL